MIMRAPDHKLRLSLETMATQGYLWCHHCEQAIEGVDIDDAGDWRKGCEKCGQFCIQFRPPIFPEDPKEAA